MAIVFTLTHSYNAWVGRIGNASNGDVVAAAIQADAHRLIGCAASSTELDFCLVDGTRSVAYCTVGPAPHTLIRASTCAGGGPSQVMVRGLDARPTFHVHCDGTPGAGSGYIEADGVRGIGALLVYFHGPLGQCRES